MEYKEAKHVFSCGKELLTRWLTSQPLLGENVEETAPASAYGMATTNQKILRVASTLKIDGEEIPLSTQGGSQPEQ